MSQILPRDSSGESNFAAWRQDVSQGPQGTA